MITRNRVLLPLSALLVAALIAGLAWVLSSRSPHDPAVLRLLGAGGPASRDLAVPAMGAAESRSSGSSGYRLTGQLPGGQPADAPAYALEVPYDTTRLTRALGRDGLTTEHASWWWTACSSKPTSVEPAPGSGPAQGAPDEKPAPEPAPGTTREQTLPPPSADESIAACSGAGVTTSGTVSSDPATPTDGSKSEPSAQPAPRPEPTDPAMTKEQAMTAAKPVFEAVDLPINEALVVVTPYGASVHLDPMVHGLRTSGYTTRVEIDKDRQIAYASGFMGQMTRGDSYPLVTAQQAFDSIPSPPAMDMLCPVGPDGKGCVAPPAPEVTGAVLGLQLRQDADAKQLLVPAWLFAVKGWDEPVGQIAIPEKYLGDPNATPSGGAKQDPGAGQTQPGGGSDGGTRPVPPADKPTSEDPTTEPAPSTKP